VTFRVESGVRVIQPMAKSLTLLAKGLRKRSTDVELNWMVVSTIYRTTSLKTDNEIPGLRKRVML
jgi:hypothetical protein